MGIDNSQKSSTSSRCLNNSSSTRGPNHKHTHRQWARDTSTQRCSDCSKSFTLLTRRHHCRKCGQIFCNQCTLNRLVVKKDANNKNKSNPSDQYRVCDRCIDGMINDGLLDDDGIDMVSACGFGGQLRRLAMIDGVALRMGSNSLIECSIDSFGGLGIQNNANSKKINADEKTAVAVGTSHATEKAKNPQNNSENFLTRISKMFSIAGFEKSPSTSESPKRTEERREDADYLSQCPVCGKSFKGLKLTKCEKHVQECFTYSQRNSRVGKRYSLTAWPKKEIDKEECPICFEEYEAGSIVALLECFCRFHRECIDDWLGRGKQCPFHAAP